MFDKVTRRVIPRPPLSRRQIPRGISWVLFLIFIGFLSCSPKKKDNVLIQKGQTLYQAHCIACHHATNPKIAGAIGPEISGSSLELLEARIKRAEYPSDYMPKRPTKLMVALPQLTDEDIKALHSYLNQ